MSGQVQRDSIFLASTEMVMGEAKVSHHSKQLETVIGTHEAERICLRIEKANQTEKNMVSLLLSKSLIGDTM